MILGTTDDIEKWSSIIVSSNGRKIIGQVGNVYKEAKYKEAGLLSSNKEVKLKGTDL